jgi:transposase-like protein
VVGNYTHAREVFMGRGTRRAYTPKLKFQVVLEALTGERSPGQIAKAYGVHANSIGLWKKSFLERGPEIFSRDNAVEQYERRIAELERLLGQKEVEIALLKNFLSQGA